MKLTKKQQKLIDDVQYAMDNPEWSWDGKGGCYIETGYGKPYSGSTVNSLFKKGLIRYADGGTSYRQGAGTHVLVLVDQ